METVAVLGDPIATHALSEAVMLTVTVSVPSTIMSAIGTSARVAPVRPAGMLT